ncbi:MAG: bifunctional UDP-sugar hydrolase/5'-nucleotidase [Bacteroidota bacterium]
MKSCINIILFTAVIFTFSSCKPSDNQPDGSKITIIYTNDEHGWMEPTNEFDGAAGLSGLWKSREGYDGSDSYLILSGGDMWTGPAISTWFRGESMVEVMNLMGYDAAAIGNHEFDFTADTLNKRLQQMNFPLLSANITEKSSGNIPAFAKPYIIRESSGVKVGIIGLSSLSTPFTTFPAYVEDYEFTSYSDAIDKYAPLVKNEGADIIIVIGHICQNEMEALVPTAKKHNIPLIGGGHCHQNVLKTINDVLLIQSGAEMKAYVKVELQFNPETNEAKINSSEIVPNQNSTPDNEIETIVEHWQAKTQEALSEEIGYCSEIIYESSISMGNMVTDSWFHTFPDADVSITNSGGIRQNINQGSIKLLTIVGLLPFENSIYELNLTGSELIDCIDNYLIGGMTTIGGYTLSDGTPIYSDSTYSVLTTDYLYSADPDFSKYDQEPNNTSVNYRQPLIDWIKSLNTTSQAPLNNYLDNIPRR